LRGWAGCTGAVVPDFQIPIAVGIFADERAEALFRLAIEIGNAATKEWR